jgi:hypothetical protein
VTPASEVLSLDPESVILSASQAVGVLNDFPCADYYRRHSFITSEASQRRRSAMGVYLLREELATAVRNSIRLIQNSHTNPIEGCLGEPPIVIVGFPRSGTTLFHHLLSHDVSNRTLSVGEALLPARETTEAERRDAADSRSRLVERLSPPLMRIHPALSWGPEECSVLELANLISIRLGLYLDSQVYMDWYIHYPMVEHYRWFVGVLAQLGRSEGHARWVLKSPGHGLHLGALAEAMGGGMRVVLLRRDRHQIVASWHSLATAVSRLLGLREPVHVDWSGVWSTAAHRLAGILSMPGLETATVDFSEIVSDPVGAVESTYDTFGLEFGPSLRSTLTEFVSRDPLRCWGKHVYEITHGPLE